MKKLLKGALIAACVLLTGGFAKAQTKIGYINFQNLVTADPQFKNIQTQVDQYQQQFIETMKGMQTELQTKGNDYETKKGTMTDAQRTKTEAELQDLNKRIQDLNQQASQQVQQKYSELTKPLVDKWKAAISQVAKEKGYTYVVDSSQTELLVAPETDDLMAAVKAKVGVSPAAPAKAPVKK